MSEHKYALGVIGAGHIARVMLNHLLYSGYLSGKRIICTSSRYIREHPLDVVITEDPKDVVLSSRMVMISVTPQKFPAVAHAIHSVVAGDRLFLSVMAGVSTDRVADSLGGPVRVVRAMPNLPFGLGCGVTGLFKGRHATQDDLEEAKHFFAAGGAVVEVNDEGLMDAVTAVAGSGPAYFYHFVEMMIAGGVAAGLKEEDAQTLAAHACVGAGRMMLQRGASPAQLREAVTSPGGTTEAALRTLKEHGVAEHVTAAVQAAFKRSRELGKGPPTPSPS